MVVVGKGIGAVGKRMRIAGAALLLAAMALLVAVRPAAAALPAPNWMPGSPILAGEQVILLWTPVPGAVKYFVYLNDQKTQESPSIQVVVAAPAGSGQFEYKISAVDAAGVEGAKSVAGIVKIFKLVPPTGLEGRMLGKKVAVHWNGVSGAILYNVYRSEDDKNFQLADSIQDVQWTDGKAQEGKKYFYRVTAKDAGGKESEPGKSIMVDTKSEIAATGEARNVVGLRTRQVFRLTDKDFTEKGILRIAEPYDIEPSPDRSVYYVSSVHTQSVLMIDPKGNLIGKFGEAGDGPGQFRQPYGIGVGPDGKVYVVDFVKLDVQVFTPDGKFLEVFAKLERQKWMTTDPKPTDVAVDEKGNVHVLEYYHGAVLTYGPGKDLRSYFMKGGSKPEDSAYLTYLKYFNGRFFLADSAKARVIMTDTQGKTLGTIGVQGAGVGYLSMLGGFDIADGKVWMTDRQTFLVQVYDLKTNKYLFTLANDDNTKQFPVTAPKMLSVDPSTKRVCVTQGIVNQVACFELVGSPEEAKGK